jgi:hypothetical protein
MKTVRFVTILIAVMLVFSAWTPSPVLAKAEAATAGLAANSVSGNVDLATAKQVKLTINNNTGGTIYITLSGTRFYSFAATKQGKNIFMIEKGKYTATIRASACGGVLTKKVNGAASLGTIVCRKSKKTK